MQDHAAHEENAQTQGATPPGGIPPQKPPATCESDGTEGGGRRVSDFVTLVAGFSQKEKNQLYSELLDTFPPDESTLSEDETRELERHQVKAELYRAVELAEAEEKRTAAFSLTWHYLSRARYVLCAAMLESDVILAQTRLTEHVKTVDTLLRQDPKSEQFTVGGNVNGIGNNARLLAEACASSSWAEVEYYMNVFKTAFGI